MTRDFDIISKFNAPVILRKPVSQAASRLADVPRRGERAGDAIDDTAGGASERVVDMMGMMNICEDCGVGEAGASAAAYAGTGK